MKHNVNTLYTECTKEEADCAVWAFRKPFAKPELMYHKFRPMAEGDIRIAVEWAGLCHSDVHCV